MPIYEYECNACSERHEFIQKFSDAPTRKCPACGKSRLRKLVSAAAFHLKGNGWYVTDFRDKDKGKANGKGDGKGDGAQAADGAAKPDGKGDAQATPEAKPDKPAEGAASKKAGAKKDKGAPASPA